MSDDQSTAPHSGHARGHRTLQEEPLDVILSPELDKMVSDGETHLVLHMLIYSILQI